MRLKFDFTYNLPDTKQRSTSVMIYDLDRKGLDGSNKKFLYKGYAICSPKDCFRKAIGRKVAVKDAVKDELRTIRRLVWTEYFKGHKVW